MRKLDLYFACFGSRLQGGPFRGMAYVRESVCSILSPKLLGTYESELNDWIEALLAQPTRLFVNIGAAEGYYAVGFARRGKCARLVAFEGEATGRALLDELAALNDVAGRIEVRGFCTTDDLAATLGSEGDSLILVDVEGAEAELLDSQRVPALQQATLLVEIHEDRAPVADILRARFASTHEIAERWTVRRTRADLPTPLLRFLARFVPERMVVSAMNEQRPGPMRWFLCTPHGRLPR